MTNATIIQNAQLALMEAGKIGTTGRTLKAVDGVGNTITIPEPEPIHTYQRWKELGYQVQKGQKAVARLSIWKYAVKKMQSEDGVKEQPETRMFMKTAAFFSFSQVEAVTA